MSYTIAINEQQRKVIAEALRAHYGDAKANYMTDNDADEGRCLRDLFEQLPEDAKDAPKDSVFGFCI